MSDDSRTIFEHRDEDGDLVRITAWTVSPAPGPDLPNLILRTQDGAEGDSVSVRLYPDQVRDLIDSLVAWYAIHGDTRISFEVGGRVRAGHEPEYVIRADDKAPETVTIPLGTHLARVGAEPTLAVDPVRLEALRLAVQIGDRHDDPLDVAREFENYLRFGVGQVDPGPWSEPESDAERDCLCHHPRRLHLTPDGGNEDGPCRVDMCSCTERVSW